MTGIERLREFAKGCRLTGQRAYSNAIGDIADQIEREHAEDCFRMGERAAEDAEAVAWAREHGGLDYVRAEWRSRVPYDRYVARRQRLLGHIAECETALGRRNDRIEELGRRVNDLTTENAELRKRAMPEGCEWPRYESGELVRIGDKFECWCGETHVVSSVTIREGRSVLNECQSHSFVVGDGSFTTHGQCVKRPAPKALDADGAEVEVGDDLYSVEGSLKFHVSAIDTKSGRIATEAMLALDKWADPAMYTHRAPVLAADGLPLREGDRVWSLQLDEPHEWTVLRPDDGTGRVLVSVSDDTKGRAKPENLTHERPDSWERLEEDATRSTCGYFGHVGGETCETCPGYAYSSPQGGRGCRYAHMADLVRRARALAERERGE